MIFFSSMNFTIFIFVSLLLLIGALPTDILPQQISREPKRYTDDFAVAIDGTEADARLIAESGGYVFVRKIVSNYYLFRKPATSQKSIGPGLSDIRTLKQKTKVLDVQQQVRQKRVLKRITDPEWDNMWFLNGAVLPSINIEEAWAKGFEGKGVKIAVLDDGVEEDHPDLRANMLTDISYDFLDDDEVVTPEIALNGSHGTVCAGLIVAGKNNGYCIVGVAPEAKVAGIRIFSDEDGTTDATEASALAHALDQIDIYSNSWGPIDGAYFSAPGPLAQLSLSLGITEGRNGRGAIYVWAAGNGRVEDNCNADGYANSIYTIAITSMASDGLPAFYSEYCAPAMAAVYGGDENQTIISTDFGSTCTDDWQGTSFSTPQAAGIIALALQANPKLTWRDVQHLIVRTSKPTTAYRGWTTNGAGLQVSDRLGFGLMDANAMVTEALTWTNVPEQTSCTLPSQSPDLYIAPQSSEYVYNIVRCSRVLYLEHVLVKVGYSTFSRGHASLTLTSPSGTESKLLTERALEEDYEDFFEWTYMSVQFWGEQPNGIWKLTVSQGGTSFDQIYYDYTGLLSEWQLIFYGTETDPSSVVYSNNTTSGADGSTPETSTDKTTTTTSPDSRTATTKQNMRTTKTTPPDEKTPASGKTTYFKESTTQELNITTDVAELEKIPVSLLVAGIVGSCVMVSVLIVLILRRLCQKVCPAKPESPRSDPLRNISNLNVAQPVLGPSEGSTTTPNFATTYKEPRMLNKGMNPVRNQLYYIVSEGSDKRTVHTDRQPHM